MCIFLKRLRILFYHPDPLSSIIVVCVSYTYTRQSPCTPRESKSTRTRVSNVNKSRRRTRVPRPFASARISSTDRLRIVRDRHGPSRRSVTDSSSNTCGGVGRTPSCRVVVVVMTREAKNSEHFKI